MVWGRFWALDTCLQTTELRRIADRRLSNRNRPAATLVKCFEVDDQAEVVIVFARTSDHARELFDL